MTELLYKEEVYAIIGAAMKVHNELGPGFLEAIYQEALEVELKEGEIPFKPQQELTVFYKGKQLKKYYVADLMAFDQIIIEIKAISQLTPIDEAQLVNELKINRSKLGLLINFGAEKLEWKRKVNLKE